jgi:hypothetical protein
VRLDRGVPDLEGRVTFQDPEALVLAMVDVQRSGHAGGVRGLGDLDQAQQPPVCSAVALISARPSNHHLASPSPECVAMG